MSDLAIGTARRKAFTLPPEIVTQTTAVLGIRGSGKTNTATVMAEELLGRGHPVVVIDPLDVWWGLKSSADGKAPGHAVVVLGGPHGDLPLQEADGEVLADFVVEHQVPLILSLRHLRKGAQRRFVTDFAERLYHRKGELAHRVPLLVVIDEADEFVPQRVQHGEARMVGAIEDLVRRGRAAGIGVVLISQRAASINKDVLTQLELLIAHRHTSPQDRKALQEWVHAHDTAGREADFMAALAGLPIGTAWFWSPGWLDVFDQVRVRARLTFDSSKTPKLGAQVKGPERAAAVDLDALRVKLQTTVEDARANDPKELRRRIAELERERRKGSTGEELVAAVQLREGLETALGQAKTRVRELETYTAAVRSRITEGSALLERAAALLRNGDGPPAPGPAAAAPFTARRPTGIPRGIVGRQSPAARRAAPNPGTGSLPRGEGAVLTAACQYPDGVDRQQISILTGYKRSSRDAYIQRLKDRGLVEVRGNLVLAARGAEEHLGEFEPLPTGGALREYWLGRLPLGERAVLQVLIDHHPDGLPRDAISERTEYRRSSRDAYIQRLKARKVIEVEGAVVRASEMLF